MSSIQNSRLIYLDFLRGIAVLGLLIMNMPKMGIAEFGYIPFSPDLISDTVIRATNALFFDGRFRSLFCLLFGIGLYLQYCSYQDKGLNAHVIIKTRLNWLFVFGLLHGVFIWFGDILLIYALCGRVMLGQLNESSDYLIQKGIKWISLGLIMMFVFSYLVISAEPVVTRDSEQYIEAVALATQHYFADWPFNLATVVGYIITFPFLSMLSLGGVMYLAVGLFKSSALKRGFSTETLVKLSILTVSFSLLDAYLAVFQVEIWNTVANVLGSVSGLAMALLIWHLVLKTKVYLKQNIFVKAIRNVGQLALSFYLFQSIAGTVILQILLANWLADMTLLDYWSLAFALILLQLILALVYKTFFKQGPLEYLWRNLVQRKIDKLPPLENR